jgi:fumarylacetoacetase
MAYSINETHDPALQCWVESAHAPGTEFPIQNLPFGVFMRRTDEAPRMGVAIGNSILDLAACAREGFFENHCPRAGQACLAPNLNELMALDSTHWSSLRRCISGLLRSDGPEFRRDRKRLRALLLPIGAAEMLVPAAIGDYTDCYASVFHATNVGRMMRPQNPLLPNYKYMPIAYHGRASSIVISGTHVRRPSGQTSSTPAVPPAYGPSRNVDYELEVGFFVGKGNELGAPIPMQEAEQNLFGLCLVNDWSARDIQRWEYQPLGPFLSKSFATTISPWVVTLEALEPFRVPAFPRPPEDPQALPYLADSRDCERGGIDVELEVLLCSGAMREKGIAPARLSRSYFRDMYWTAAQMISHHSSNGCNLRPGDLIASGTVSGSSEDSRGCLLELAWRGERPVALPTGEERRFLEDGDEIILRGHCARPGFASIGFGECRGTVQPS